MQRVSWPQMETFDADWLALRELVDHRSRAVELIEPLVAAWERGVWMRVVDLGSGTGSNVRYLASRLPSPQRWTLVDHDPAHLRTVGNLKVNVPSCELAVVLGDIGSEGLRAVARADLVTASALLDLVSARWLDRLVAACVEAGCAALFALNYNGKITWSADDGPDAEVEDPDDRVVWNALSIHQVGDKGLGPSLGPDAGVSALRAFERVGYQCYFHPSSWRLGVDDAALVHRLVKGWAEAAAEILPQESDRISAWAARRSEVVSERRFMLTVGHDDLLALPRDSA